jgi:uncharacterized protein YceK
MIKKILMSLMLVGFLAGCGTIHSIVADPSKQQVADAVVVEAAGYVMDTYPELRAPIVQIATQAKTLLSGTGTITKAGAVSWLNSQINNVPNMNVHAKRLIDTVALVYMPSWDSSTLNFLSAQDKQILLNLCDLLALAAQN